jgi:hypothetical protein
MFASGVRTPFSSPRYFYRVVESNLGRNHPELLESWMGRKISTLTMEPKETYHRRGRGPGRRTTPFA